jgi:hypothetical protein
VTAVSGTEQELIESIIAERCPEAGSFLDFDAVGMDVFSTRLGRVYDVILCLGSAVIPPCGPERNSKRRSRPSSSTLSAEPNPSSVVLAVCSPLRTMRFSLPEHIEVIAQPNDTTRFGPPGVGSLHLGSDGK